ncbi:MAG TPA: hypothetical protein VL652_09720 [Kutzneria sp.]|nr:hypothetical protein [Kutzneria sp.]
MPVTQEFSLATSSIGLASPVWTTGPYCVPSRSAAPAQCWSVRQASSAAAPPKECPM